MVLLVCGVLSSLLYVATDVLAPMRWEAYSSTSQTVSELIAIGAPTRPLVLPLMITYSVLVFAFGWGFGDQLVKSALCASRLSG
jgi:hypothetical protein